MASVKIIRPAGRPTKVQQNVIAWSKDVGEWIIDWLSKNDRVASGETINSLEVEVSPNSGSVFLTANSSLAFALQGRKAGRFPRVDAIKGWIQNKKIQFNPSEITLDQLAYLIGRKIAKSGTSEPKLRPQNIDIVINNLGKKYEEQLGDQLAEEVADAMIQAWATRNLITGQR